MVQTSHWPRAIVLLDMDAFFASVEQLDNPDLRGHPVVVTNGQRGTCVITSSYEARIYGIKTGMRLPEARRLCPHLIQCPSRSKRYAELSTRIMEALQDITPDIEVYSVDEAYLDLTHCQKLYESPVEAAYLVQKLVYEVSGVTCSVGVSGDKTTAKYAAKLHKPGGLVAIPPWEAKARLAGVPVTELSGIAKGIGQFLASYGVHVCGDIERIPISVLSKRYGRLGKRIWYMCQGADPAPVQTNVAPPKSMGHGKVMPPHTTDSVVILTYFSHMAEKLAARLRRHDMQAQHFWIGLRLQTGEFLYEKAKLAYASADAKDFLERIACFMRDHWAGEPVCQVQFTALDPKPTSHQLDLFQDIQTVEQRGQLHDAVDSINDRFGSLAIAPARILSRAQTGDVIAPAWKPKGHRRTV